MEGSKKLGKPPSMMRKVHENMDNEGSRYSKAGVETNKSEGRLSHATNSGSILRFNAAVESFDVTRHLEVIEEAIKIKNVNMDQRMHLEQIVDILDAISKTVSI